ncbi:MAG: hypothetical protein JW866_08580 [Ignavibacteriales bacterium]|nr:hypothetical protein [Ignavibacteriales bacterium]
MIIFCNLIYSQGSAGSEASYEFRSLIDMQSAGVLKNGNVGVSVYAMSNGVLITTVEAGVFDNFNIGISYGGSNIIGKGNIALYKLPGVLVKYRIINESYFFPAFTFGFNSQGRGDYIDSLNRYEFKSKGFYASVTKNFQMLGFLSIHGSVNYSLENKEDKNVNFSIGLEKTISKNISFVIEYDFALNDDAEESFGKGKGYLNVGLKWSIGQGMTIGADVRNLINNNKKNQFRADRAIFLEYIQPIF